MGEAKVAVLRLGHRRERDKRVTTHVALVARAFGANSILISERDAELESTIRDVVSRFGGDFTIVTGVNWRNLIREWRGTTVHLTMYGEPLEDAIVNIAGGDFLVVVGAEKVPGEVFKLADHNIAVGSQPHSEVAALAIFLDRISKGEWARLDFGGERVIIPSKEGKIVIDPKRGYLSDDDCRRILRDFGCDEGLIEHMEDVARIAVKMAELCDADVDLVRTASMLHDIGRSVTHGPEHGYEGGVILKGLCFPESIISIVERHVGGGLTAKGAKELGLPERDLIPTTMEEKIVCIADKLIEDNRRSTIDEEVEKLRKKGLRGSADRLLALYKELEEMCGLDLDQLQV